MSDIANSLKSIKRTAAGTGELAVDRVVAKLEQDDPEAARELKKALQDTDRVSQRALSDVLSAAGHGISDGAIGTWRRRNLKPKAG